MLPRFSPTRAARPALSMTSRTARTARARRRSAGTRAASGGVRSAPASWASS